MKKLSGILAGLVLPLALVAGEADQVVFDSTFGPLGKTSVPTNGWFAAGMVLTSTVPISGYVKNVEIITSGNAQTCAVSLITFTNTGTQVAQTIFSNMTVSASAVYRPRVTVHDTSGAALMSNTNAFEEIFLVEERLQLNLWKSVLTNNCTIKVKVTTWR